MTSPPDRTGEAGEPYDDGEVEALLAGLRTDDADLASLEELLGELRAPRRGPVPRPSAELARLFAGGPAERRPPVAGPSAPAPAPPQPVGRRPARRLAKAAAVTTGAALAVTLAAAAQVLPGLQQRVELDASRPATPVRVGVDQNVATGLTGVSAGAEVTVSTLPAAPTGRATVTIRPQASPDLDLSALSPEALGRLPLDVLRTLPLETLAKVPVDVLRTLPADALARLPADVLRTLPGDALARLPADVLRTLPGDALARVPVDVLATLPGDALLRLPGDVLRALPGDALARLPVDVLRALPADVQRRLPADVLRLLLLRP